MPKSDIDSLLSRYPLISDQVDVRELKVILSYLDRVLEQKPDAAVVEFGCYIGTTSLFIRRVMNHHKATGTFHVYDSFAGLPEKTGHDASPAGEQFKTGELAVTKKQFERQFLKAGLQTPVTHKAWFADVDPADVPKSIGFAYLDGDYYDSILDSLKLVWPKMTTGGYILVDDYMNEALPGAARAVDEWVRGHGGSLRTEASLAIISI